MVRIPPHGSTSNSVRPQSEPRPSANARAQSTQHNPETSENNARQTRNSVFATTENNSPSNDGSALNNRSQRDANVRMNLTSRLDEAEIYGSIRETIVRIHTEDNESAAERQSTEIDVATQEAIDRPASGPFSRELNNRSQQSATGASERESARPPISSPVVSASTRASIRRITDFEDSSVNNTLQQTMDDHRALVSELENAMPGASPRELFRNMMLLGTDRSILNNRSQQSVNAHMGRASEAENDGSRVNTPPEFISRIPAEGNENANAQSSRHESVELARYNIFRAPIGWRPQHTHTPLHTAIARLSVMAATAPSNEHDDAYNVVKKFIDEKDEQQTTDVRKVLAGSASVMAQEALPKDDVMSVLISVRFALNNKHRRNELERAVEENDIGSINTSLQAIAHHANTIREASGLWNDADGESPPNISVDLVREVFRQLPAISA